MAKEKFESVNSEAAWDRGVLHLKKNDKILARIITTVGPIKLDKKKKEPYDSLMRMFIYQQIAGSAADSILKRFEQLYGGRLPTPKEFLKTPEKRVRSAGISPQKYSYIKDLCERIVSGRLKLDGLATMSDDEIILMLDEVRGIGRWTAEAFLMFNMGRINVFPTDDLGLINGIKGAYKIRTLDRKRLEALTKKWEPYKSIAALYLWRNLDKKD